MDFNFYFIVSQIGPGIKIIPIKNFSLRGSGCQTDRQIDGWRERGEGREGGGKRTYKPTAGVAR